MAILIGIFGVMVGSFANVVIYRLPIKRSIVSPPSACTACGNPIKKYDNIPILSWFILGGKCRSCKSRISFRYPLIELGTGLLFATVAWRFSSGAIPLMFAFLYLAAISIVLGMIDLDTHTLPNKIVIPSYFVGTFLLGIASLMSGNSTSIFRGLVGMTILVSFYYALAFIYPGGMGMGDVKFAGVLGLFLGYQGWGVLAVGAFSAFLLGGFFAIILIFLRKTKRKSGIPFGPWMVLGAWVGVFFSVPIVQQYLSIFGLNNQF